MPPQKTTLTSETARDVAGLRLERSVALGKVATVDNLAVGRREAEIAAPIDACQEKAGKRPAALTRNILSLLGRCWRAFREKRQRDRLRVSLRDLSNRELMDIGLTPGDIECIDAHRTIERLRDGTWQSRGAM